VIAAMAVVAGPESAAQQDQSTVEQGRCPAKTYDLKIYGSDTVGEKLMPALIDEYFTNVYPRQNDTSLVRYERRNLDDRTNPVQEYSFEYRNSPLKSVCLSREGTRNGIERLESGEADIAMASTIASRLEHEEHPIAFDGIVVWLMPKITPQK
jgi:ABC-type phosphate transport system substrate-binding protein